MKTHLPLLSAALVVFATLTVAPLSRAYAEEAVSKGDEPKSDDAKGDDKGKTAEAAKNDKKKSDDVSGGRFAGDPIYVHISPMVLPVINDSGVEQLVTIILDVQVKNFDSADDMHTNMPKVMDSLMRALYGGLGQGVLRNGKLVNVGKIKNKAITAVGEVIGAENIQDVLVQGVSQRML